MTKSVLMVCLIGSALVGGGVGYNLHRIHPPSAAAVRTITVAAQAETVYRVKRDTLWRYLTRYDTVRQTLNVHDTLSVTEYVYVADSTISACRVAVAACDSTIQKKNAAIEALQKSKPSRWQKVGTAALWLGAGFGLHSLTRSH